MTLYISGPMTGIEDFNYPAFEEMQTELRRQGYDVRSPHDNPLIEDGGVPGSKSWQYYMTKAIELQMQCTGWVGLSGWPNSKGALREFTLAAELGHELYLPRWRVTGVCELERIW